MSQGITLLLPSINEPKVLQMSGTVISSATKDRQGNRHAGANIEFSNEDIGTDQRIRRYLKGDQNYSVKKAGPEGPVVVDFRSGATAGTSAVTHSGTWDTRRRQAS